MPSEKRVDFFYDFSCPYAYLGHTQIEAVCERAGARLVWRPFLLGGVFKALGGAAPMTPPKARHNFLDMFRWADHFGVPLRMPRGHPNRTVLALRATIAAGGDVVAASKALFRAYWVDSRDLSDPAVVIAALHSAGLDGAGLVARAGDASIKDALRVCTEEALAAGVFGAPAFVVHAPGVDGDLYWGQDRLELIEKALGGWSVPPLAAAAGATRA